MSERHEPNDEDERTDPSIQLPDDALVPDPTMQVDLPEQRSQPPPLPPGAAGGSTRPPSRPPDRPRSRPPERSLPSSRPSTRPGPAAAAPSRPSPQTGGTLRPPAGRPASIPPAQVTRGSEPPARTDPSAPERQRLAQMEVQLDQARSALARQRHEMDELRARLGAKEQRLDELMQDLREASSAAEIEQRFAALDAQRDALADELRKRFEEGGASSGGAERIESLETRLRSLEEGTEISRIRMRLERTGLRLDALEGRMADFEAGQQALRETLERAHGSGQRVERLESLFDEMAQELRELRDTRGDEELQARVADLETLVLQTGTNEKALREQLEAQTGELRRLSESIAPPARTASASGDDLTRIKGVGPKYARGLVEMGASTIAEIAEWSDDEVQRAATTLGVKASRVRRWVQAAKAL